MVPDTANLVSEALQIWIVLLRGILFSQLWSRISVSRKSGPALVSKKQTAGRIRDELNPMKTDPLYFSRLKNKILPASGNPKRS